MIKKLKIKFIVLATASILLLMTVILSAINIINYSSVTNYADNILSLMSQSDIFFDDVFLPPGMSPEVPYESRYFTSLVSSEGIIITNIDRIVSVSKNTAINYVQKAISKNGQRGFVDNFRFAKFSYGENTRIVFLDCGRQLDGFYDFLFTSILIGFAGCVVVFLIFLLAANKIVRPIAESYSKQKQFISDAGHEIKTPLTVISANADLLELEFGENECISDIREQTKQLTVLTNELVSLSRMEEANSMMIKSDFPLSELVSDVASYFHALATSQNKHYSIDIVSGITMNGSPESIRQLVSILLDNAFKYSPEDGNISIKMTATKKEMVLSVFNTTISQLKKEDLQRIFDRFYRTDESRNSETGGHGIGLSLAKVITESHGGKISADTQSGYDFTITAVIPL